MTDKPTTIFTEMPCLIELCGHNRIAGRVSEVSIGGSALLRVDVPAVDGVQAFTKYFGLGAIYAITPTGEKMMLLAVKGMQPKPIERYQFSLPNVIPDDGRTLQDEIRDIESGDFDPEDFDDEDFEDDFDDDEEDEDDEDFGSIADREYSQHKDDLDTGSREVT